MFRVTHCQSQEKVKPYTSTYLISNYQYDSYGRLIKETDPMGFKVDYVYDSSGRLSSTKNYRDQETKYTYDALGRLTHTHKPNKEMIQSTHYWSNLPNVSYVNFNYVQGHPWEKTYYDALNRPVKTSKVNLGTTDREPPSDRIYDSYGRLSKVSLPYPEGGSPSYWTIYSYDNYDRITSVVEPSGRKTSYSYNGKSVTTTKDGVARTRNYDAQGNVTSVSDPGGTITYNLRPDGQASSIVAPGNITTSFGYDSYGRQTSIVDPSAGTQTYTYDDAGNIRTEKDALNRTISYEYDSFGRITKKTCPEFVTDYKYNDAGTDNKQLASVVTNNGTATYYTYDGYDRIKTVKEVVPDGKFLQKTYFYIGHWNGVGSVRYDNQDGYIASESYIYDNTSNGHLSEMKINSGTFWKLNTMNVFEQPTSVTTGSFNRSYGYTAHGIPSSRSAGSFQSFSYNFDASKGNLTNRKDNKTNIQENFTYDNLNRLTGFAGKTAGYDTKGNLTSKSNVGTFAYNTTGKPYAMSGVTTSQSAIPLRAQSMSYTSFKRPMLITENGYSAVFTYNSNYQRVKMELKKNGLKEMNRYYIGDCYEIDDRAVGGIKQKLYLGGDYYTAPAVYVKEGSGAWQLYYICRDYLGSITHITNSSGSVVQELSYDAWGQLRNPANQTNYAPDSEPALFLGRGYTGHEHLSQFGLINMNARLYDPALGRFLSPDPYVQAPDMTQNFNRYSYCLNNPLRYTDEDGEWVHIVVGAIVGGVVNWVSNGCEFTWEGFSYFGVGAAAGALTAVAPGAFTYISAGTSAANSVLQQGYASNWQNVNAGQVFFDGIIGGTTSYVSGAYGSKLAPHINELLGNINSPLLNNFLASEIIGVPFGATLGGLSTLGDSERNFWSGVWSGTKSAFVSSAISGFGNAVQYSVDNKVNLVTGKSKTPTQTHHFASNKNSQYSPEMEAIAKKYELDLDGDWNKSPMPHQGRHPNAYHKWVIENMRSIDAIPGMNQQQFIKHFNLRIKQPVLKNPQMLRKNYWK